MPTVVEAELPRVEAFRRWAGPPIPHVTPPGLFWGIPPRPIDMSFIEQHSGEDGGAHLRPFRAIAQSPFPEDDSGL